MPRFRILWLLLTLLGILALYLFLGKGDRAPASSSHAQTRQEVAGASEPPASASPSPTADIAREEAAPLAAGSSSATSTDAATEGDAMITFRGRCVAQESGEPLAGVEVKLRGWPGNDRLVEKYGNPQREAPEPIYTDADGDFLIRYPVTPAYQFAMDLRIKGRLQRSGRWYGGWLEEHEVDLGEVRLIPGKEVHGIVRKMDGTPVNNISVSASGFAETVAGLSAGSINGWSQEDGHFTLSSAIPPGHWQLRVNGKGYLYHGESMFRVPEEGEVPLLDLRVEEAPRIAGMVSDAEGNPLARVEIQSLREGSGASESTRTGEDGTFTLFARRPSLEPVPLNLRAEGFLPKQTEPYSWGTTNLRFVLQPTLSFSVRVVADDTGEPIEDYLVHAYSSDGQTSAGSQVIRGPHPQGVSKVSGLTAGKGALNIAPVDQSLEAIPALDLQVHAQMPLLEVRLHRQQALRVLVLDPDGLPLPKAKVTALSAAPEPRFWDNVNRVRESGRPWPQTAYVRNPPLALSFSLSDEQGQGTVYFPAEQGNLVLLVESRFPHLIAEIPGPAAGQEITLQVAPRGSLRGLVRNPPAASGAYALVLGNGGLIVGDRAFVPADSPLLIWPASDGSFTVADLEPKNYPLRLLYPPLASDLAQGVDQWWSHPKMVTFVRVESGQETFLEVDASGYRRGSLQATVLLDGQPAGSYEVSLELGTHGGANGLYSTRTDAAGSFAVDGIPVGEYQLRIRVGEGWVDATDFASVQAEQETQVTFHGRHRRLRLRLVDELGNTFPLGTPVEVSYLWFQEFKLDQEGLLALDPAPRDPGQLRCARNGIRFSSAEIDFESLDAEEVITIEMSH